MSNPAPASTAPDTVLLVEVKKKSSVPDPPLRLANFEYANIVLSVPALAPVSCQTLAPSGPTSVLAPVPPVIVTGPAYR